MMGKRKLLGGICSGVFKERGGDEGKNGGPDMVLLLSEPSFASVLQQPVQDHLRSSLQYLSVSVGSLDLVFTSMYVSRDRM